MKYTFRIKITGSQDPIIWRKIEVNANTTFEHFHLIIQALFGFTDSHLYMFSPRGWRSYPCIKLKTNDGFETYSKNNSFPYGELYNPSYIRLKDYFENVGKKIQYIYDFGDEWQIQIDLKKTDPKERIITPKCIGGRGNNVIEDCGGLYGYYETVSIINDPSHEEYEEMREWVGIKDGGWDENAFDINIINKNLNTAWQYILSENKRTR